jgi:hypothetical protein
MRLQWITTLRQRSWRGVAWAFAPRISLLFAHLIKGANRLGVVDRIGIAIAGTIEPMRIVGAVVNSLLLFSSPRIITSCMIANLELQGGEVAIAHPERLAVT